jgi:hypothetical protein
MTADERQLLITLAEIVVASLDVCTARERILDWLAKIDDAAVPQVARHGAQRVPMHNVLRGDL